MILYLTYDGLTDPLGRSQILPYILRLSKKYHRRFLIISCEKEANFQEGESRVRALIEGLPISWLPISYTKSPPIISTLWDLYRMWQSIRTHPDRASITIAHCRSYLSALIGLRMKQKWGVKFLFDMRGFWADERQEGGIWNTGTWIFKTIYDYFKRKEKIFLDHADRIVVLTHKAKEIILSWPVNVESKHISVIPCCVDRNDFQAEFKETERSKIRVELGLPKDALVITYHGSLGTWYLLDDMFAYFSTLRKHNDKARFVIYTKDDPGQLSVLQKKYHLDASDWVARPVEREQMARYLSITDFALFFIRPSFSKQASSPTKQAELMSMGIPMIYNQGVGDAERFYLEGMGDLIDLNNPAAFEKSVASLPMLKVDRPLLMRACEEHFSLDLGVDRYEEIYTALS